MRDERARGSMVLIATPDMLLRTQIARIVAQHGMIALIAMDEETTAVALQVQGSNIVCTVIDAMLLPHAQSAIQEIDRELPLVVLSESSMDEAEQFHRAISISKAHALIDIAPILDDISHSSHDNLHHYDAVYASH